MDINTINSNQSILGKELLDWILNSPLNKSDEEQEIADKLYYKYVIDRNGKYKNKIYPNVYYYVNYNNQFYPNVYLAYIVRDKLKSPKRIPSELAEFNLVGSPESYKGSLICEWAYFQNGSTENPYYMEGNEIVTKYLENIHPLKHNIFYFVNQTQRGIRIFRDVSKCPRQRIEPVEPITIPDNGGEDNE